MIVVTLMYVYLHSITISTKDFPGARNDSTHVCYSGLQSSVKTLVTRMCENENKAQVFDTAANICRLFDSPPRPPSTLSGPHLPAGICASRSHGGGGERVERRSASPPSHLPRRGSCSHIFPAQYPCAMFRRFSCRCHLHLPKP